ncbi:Uncharacterised protein [Vibrio cholerae]|nr:Uncharacterised protein [Vibrio cholerae]
MVLVIDIGGGTTDKRSTPQPTGFGRSADRGTKPRF